MSLLGSYLILKVDGSIIAETTNVSMKLVAKALEASCKQTGLYAEFIPGTVDVAIAGEYLVASDGANWDALWNAFKAGTEVTVTLLRYGVEVTSGTAIIVILRTSGADSGSLVTGGYGLRYKPGANVIFNTTVDSTTITVDSTLITSDQI